MMNIKLNKEYKSLQPFESDELENLTIITGKNGSGKTQLMELVRQGANENNPSGVEIIPKVQKIQSEGIIQLDDRAINLDNWKQKIQPYIETFKSLRKEELELISYLKENDVDLNNLEEQNTALVVNSERYNELIKNIQIPNRQQNNNHIQKQNVIFNSLKSRINSRFINIIYGISTEKNIRIYNITEKDFFETSFPEYLIDIPDLFGSQIGAIFYNYVKRRSENDYKDYRKERYKEINNSISDNEFINNFPPPWLMINKILEEYNMDFYFEGINTSEYNPDFPLETKLLKKSTNTKIGFGQLSSGEVVIIGLIVKLFIGEYYEETLTFPELLLLDEPDSKLHPEMSKLLLEVLQNTFVEKYGIKIIMTTHSPSTIALAPEESIYELKNGDESSLKKVNKDEALQILTNFIPTLSIDYKSHKQVFVESPTDIEYYQILHDKYQQSQKSHSKLYFISNGYGKSNCEHVYTIVEKIRESGNKTAYGIADWDLSNKDKGFTFVHGKNERYSIENFLLDPIYLVVLLMDLDGAHNIFQETGFEKTYNHLQIGDESNEKLQELIQYFFGRFESKFHLYKYVDEKTSIEYQNGKKVEIPKWYLENKGHDLETKIKQIFPALEKFRNEGDLQKKLSLIMGKCYPFVPKTSIDLIEKILNHTQ